MTGLHLWLHGGCSAPATCALLLLCKALAFFAYPSLVLLFLTKCHALRTLLSSSFLSIRIPSDGPRGSGRGRGDAVAVVAATPRGWSRWRGGRDDAARVVASSSRGRSRRRRGAVAITLRTGRRRGEDATTPDTTRRR